MKQGLDSLHLTFIISSFKLFFFFLNKESQLGDVVDDAENDLLIDKMMLVISHIASFNEEIMGYFVLSLPSPYYLRIHLACPLLWLRRCRSKNETKQNQNQNQTCRSKQFKFCRSSLFHLIVTVFFSKIKLAVPFVRAPCHTNRWAGK